MLYKFLISVVVVLIVILVVSQVIIPLFVPNLPLFWAFKDAKKGAAHAKSDSALDVADGVLSQIKKESRPRRRRG